MTSRWWFLALVAVAAPARADTPRGEGSKGDATRATDLAAFQRELNAVFTSDGLTAELAARRAAKAAPVIGRKAAALAAAEAELSRAKLSLLPILGGKATYTRLSPIDSLTIPLGAQALTIAFPEISYDAAAQVTVNLSDYLLRDPALISGAGHGVDAARLDKQAGAATVSQQARELYYEWLRARLQLLVVKRQVAQVETTLTQIRALIDVQRASNADLLRVESQRAQARQALDKLNSVVALREEQLRLLIDDDGTEPLAVGEDIRRELEAAELPEFETLAAQAGKRRPELRALDAGIGAKEALRRAEASTLLPRLSLFASADYGRPNQRVFPQKDEFRLTWAAGAQLSWVINESLVANQARNKLAAEAAQLRAERRGAEQQIRVEVMAASHAVTLAQHAIETSQQGVQAAEEGYRVRKDLFAAGRSGVVEMVDAETELSRARIAALDALIDLRIARAKLAYATGGAP